MAPKYTVTYFDIRGRGEILRLILTHAGEEFEDKRLQFADWPAIKPTTPMGFLPMIKSPNGVEISQTLACIMYLGDELKLSGANNEEKGLVNACLISLKEIHDVCADIVVFLKTDAEKEEKRAKLDKLIPHFFAYFEKLRNGNSSSQFLVGKEATIADIYFLDVVEWIALGRPGKDYLADFPKLKELNDTVRGLENVKKYLETRK